MKSAMKAKRREYVVSTTRYFPAPRERVFECWTLAEHLAHWFGPRGFTVHSVQADPHPGGAFRLVMRAPDGRDYRVRGSFRELLAPERLVIDCRADDEHGVEQLDEVIRVTITEEGKGMRLELDAVAGGTSKKAGEMLAGMEQGWSETLDRLGDRAAEKDT